MRLVITGIVVACCLGMSGAEKPKTATVEQTAIGFINALLVERDVKKASEYFDKDAERKHFGKGSALEHFSKTPLPPADKFLPREIILFRKDDVAGLQERIGPTLKGREQYKWNQLKDRIGDNLGCMLIATLKDEPELPPSVTIIIVFVFKEIGGEYKIVFQHNN